MRVVLTRFFIAASCMALAPVAVFAQGAIGGVVRDTSGGVLPGVTVEASSPALIEKVRTAVTDGTGQYLIIDLRPGTYVVTFSLPGFTSVKREGLSLSSGVTLPINAELAVGGLEETLTVTGETPVVDVQNTRTQSVVDHEVLDAIPRAHAPQLIGALMPGVVNTTRDVGGSAGVAGATRLTAHGGSGSDQVQMIDGAWFHNFTDDGAVNTAHMAAGAIQEYVFGVSSGSAEVATGGIQINAVPKDGGNIFAGSFFSDFTTGRLTSNKLSDDLRTRWGLTRTDKIDRIWNVNPAFGGPILPNRLWFFSSYQSWGTATFPLGSFYESDPGKPGRSSERLYEVLGRLTWQATPRNKFSAYYAPHGRYAIAGGSTLTSPEASTDIESPGMYLAQARWTSPVTTRLLLEAGYSSTTQNIVFLPSRFSQPGAWPITEITTGRSTGVSNNLIDAENNMWGFTGALSYVTGSHAVKVGTQHYTGHRYRNVPPVLPRLRMNNGVPFQVTLNTSPVEPRPNLKHDLGIYAQDQWKVSSRVTVNLGLRFDFFNGEIGEQYSPAGRYVPERRFAKIPNVPNWKDLNSRFGLAWDVFGTGRTAIKTALGRYIAIDAITFANSVNPMTGGTAGTGSAGDSDTRTWTDRNGDRIPQDDELGPSQNVNFGLPVFTVRPAEDLRAGWGVRGYNWEYSATVQQEVLAGLSASVGYDRRWYGNLTWTRNTLVQQSDFTPFTTVNPLDGELITMYNLAIAKRGLVNNIVESAPDNSRVFNGVDISVNGRFGRGGIANGSVSMGRTVTDTCMAWDPNQLRYCKVTPPFMAENLYKIVVSHPLPYGFQASGVFQSAPGPRIAANYTVTSAIAGVPLTAGSIVVNLLEPGSRYVDRVNQLDFRLGKTMRVGSTTISPNIAAYNVLNALPVLAQNNTYGPAWQTPTSVLVGRMFKLGIQIDF